MGSYSLTYEIFKVVGLLGVLVALSLYLVKTRKRLILGSKGPHLALIETLSLGGNRLLCLVKAGNSRILLGVTENSITLLKEMKDDEGLLDPRAEHKKDPLDAVNEKGAEDPPRNGLNRKDHIDLSGDEQGQERSAFSTALHREIRKLSSFWRGRLPIILLLVFGAFVLLSTSCVNAAPAAQNLPVPNVNIQIDGVKGQGGLLTSLGILAILTVLTLAPAILILTTSFTRIIVVFSFLRAGLGTQQTPPNQVLIGLALLLTFFVMSPTWTEVNQVAIQPYMAGNISAQKALELGQTPIRDFMLRQTREKDLGLFASIAGTENPKSPQDMSFIQIVPAFAISELRTAFEIGFILFLPFLIIDMVVASTLMSMGMLMLPPILISLPFKILLFVLVDGWALLVRTLLGSFR